MASQVFYRKWRPQILADVVGQEQVTQTLRNALSSSRVSHAYLFCGPRGTGKTSTGRILAKAVNCLNSSQGEPCNSCPVCQAITEGRALDIIEIDAASNRGIDEIRDLREKVNYAPNQARYKVYIIDEVHMLTKEASNALLKTLEEPPPHVIFILATTEAHKILPTMLSRCQRFDFRRLTQADVVSKLARICRAEGINVAPEALSLIAKSTTGSLRDAENLLEQLTMYYGSDVKLQEVQAILGITGDWRAREVVKHIINNDVSAGVKTINSVNSDGLDLRQFNRELVEYLRGLLLIKTDADAAVDLTADDIAELKDLATKASMSQILRAVKLFGQLEFGFDNYSTLPLELALVDCVLIPDEEKASPIPETEYQSRWSVETVTPSAVPSDTRQPATKPEPASKPVTSETSFTPSAVPIGAKQPTTKPEPVSVPTPEAQQTTATAIPLEPGGELEQLKLNWKQVIELAPEDTKRTPAIAILRSAGVKPVAVDNEIVTLAFRYPYHKEQIEKMENQRVAERIVGNFLGHSCRVRCVYENEDNHLLEAALKIGAQIIDVEEK